MLKWIQRLWQPLWWKWGWRTWSTGIKAFVICFSLHVFVVRLEDLQELDEQDPEITPGLFEGDQAFSDNELFSYFRVGLKWDVFPEKLWPNRTVPYAISPLYEPEDMITILTAIRSLNTMTCVKFVKWNGKSDDFLLIWPIKYPRVCWFIQVT